MQHFYHISFTSRSIIYTMINNLYILNLDLTLEYASNCSAYVTIRYKTDTSGRRLSDLCLTIFYFEMLAALQCCFGFTLDITLMYGIGLL